jgi:hypothetical protein
MPLNGPNHLRMTENDLLFLQMHGLCTLIQHVHVLVSVKLISLLVGILIEHQPSSQVILIHLLSGSK